jgi:nucleoside phosphorylase
LKGVLIPNEAIVKSYMRNNGFRLTDTHGESKIFTSSDVHDIVFVSGGIGNKSGESAAVLISNYSPDLFISIGYALSLNEEISVGGVIFCNSVISVDGPMALWNREASAVSEVSGFVPLGGLYRGFLKGENDHNDCMEGTLLSAGEIPSNPRMRKWIGKEFDSHGMDLGASDVLRACLKEEISFAIIRGVILSVDEKLSVFDRQILDGSRNYNFNTCMVPGNFLALLKSRKRRKKVMFALDQIISKIASL